MGELMPGPASLCVCSSISLSPWGPLGLYSTSDSFTFQGYCWDGGDQRTPPLIQVHPLSSGPGQKLRGFVLVCCTVRGCWPRGSDGWLEAALRKPLGVFGYRFCCCCFANAPPSALSCVPAAAPVCAAAATAAPLALLPLLLFGLLLLFKRRGAFLVVFRSSSAFHPLLLWLPRLELPQPTATRLWLFLILLLSLLLLLVTGVQR